MEALKKPCAEYNAMLPIWQQVRMAIAGKLEIDRYILGGCSYMPSPNFVAYNVTKHDEEVSVSPDSVKQRKMKEEFWGRARYLNATRRTNDSLDGFIWDSDPAVDIPSQLEAIRGKEFAQKVTYELTGLGRCGGLVDIDRDDSTVTMAERQQGAKMPYFVFYTAEQIVFWRHINGRLLEVRLLETYQEQCGDYDWETKCRIRRLFIDDDGYYSVQVFNDGDETPDIAQPRSNGQRMRFIPFQFFGSDDNSPDMSDAPLYDLASENLGHYSLSADNRNNIFWTCNGVVNIYTAMDPYEFMQKNPLGVSMDAGARNQFNQEDRMEILQAVPGNAAPEMEKVEQRMVMLGAQLVMNTNSNQTLGAKKIETNASMSTLKRISNNASDGIENMYRWAADLIGVRGDITYRLNTEFIVDDLTPQDITNLITQVQMGLMPKESIWEVNRRKGITQMDNEAIEEKINDGNVGGVSEREAELLAQIEALQMQIDGEQ